MSRAKAICLALVRAGDVPCGWEGGKEKGFWGVRRGGLSWPHMMGLEESLEPMRDNSGHGHRCKKPACTGLSRLCC